MFLYCSSFVQDFSRDILQWGICLQIMANSVTVGLGLAVLGYGGRYIARCPDFPHIVLHISSFRSTPQLVTKLESATRAIDFQLPKFDMKAWENSKYHKGGFDGKMTRREAALILGISPNSDPKKIRDAHKRVMSKINVSALYHIIIVQVMILNHPDRGGSPYMASKINEAKDFLSK